MILAAHPALETIANALVFALSCVWLVVFGLAVQRILRNRRWPKLARRVARAAGPLPAAWLATFFCLVLLVRLKLGEWPHGPYIDRSHPLSDPLWGHVYCPMGPGGARLPAADHRPHDLRGRTPGPPARGRPAQRDPRVLAARQRGQPALRPRSVRARAGGDDGPGRGAPREGLHAPGLRLDALAEPLPLHRGGELEGFPCGVGEDLVYVTPTGGVCDCDELSLDHLEVDLEATRAELAGICEGCPILHACRGRCPAVLVKHGREAFLDYCRFSRLLFRKVAGSGYRGRKVDGIALQTEVMH